MLLLTSTSDLVEVITSAVCNIQVHASFVDALGNLITPGRLNTLIVAAATTTVVASPAASTQRNVKFLSLFNAGAVDTVTVEHTDGVSTLILIKMVLPAGFVLNYNDLTGWALYNATGGLVTAST